MEKARKRERTKAHQLADIGQSLWLDTIRRSLMTSGELQRYINQGLRGMTSNPSIIDKAIAGSADYDEDFERLVAEGRLPRNIYEALAVEDIRLAADLFRPLHDATGGEDGYVSLEVSPHLAHDTEETIKEARYLFETLDRPNVMIKVPATREGYPAIEQLLGEGINVNVTLMFSLAQYDAVAEAFFCGLERLAADGGDLTRIASVASFFVSRIDVKVDPLLDEIGTAPAAVLKGKIGIANAKMAYARFEETFRGDRWEWLAERGAQVQRVLYGSTSAKDPTYPDTLYVDNLIGPQTVNTVPPKTWEAFEDHGKVERTLDQDVDKARRQLERLGSLGMDLDEMTDALLDEGVEKFAQSFESLMETIRDKRERIEERREWRHLKADLGDYVAAVEETAREIGDDDVISRVWEHDHTLWQARPDEISDRLGWLAIADVMEEQVDRLSALVEEVEAEGYERALVLGMGGSSLGPELFGAVFGREGVDLDVEVLSSTHPDMVWEITERIDPLRTLFVVASKSGTTVETVSFFRHFYTRMMDYVGERDTGKLFVAITDPDSPLSDVARENWFRSIYLDDPHVGGRYSALSFFGLVPAALAGVDVPELLDRAQVVAEGCASCVRTKDNPAAQLGAILGRLAKYGRDKATLVVSPEIAPFGDWLEQLIAESTGKSGTGILPVVHEPLGPPKVYGKDRLFIQVALEGDKRAEDQLQRLREAGHPVVRLEMRDLYDLGGQFFLWEMAVAVAGHVLGINPFNQPDVESAKERAREIVAAYQERGGLPAEEPTFEADGISVYGNVRADDARGALEAFMERAEQGDPVTGKGRSYVALQAYLKPSGETTEQLQRLRVQLRDQYRLATSLGYGPRYLHSTGQLFKGDGGNGLFVQLTADPEEDVPIPDEPGGDAYSITFGTLLAAQAQGDRQALLDGGRHVIRFHLGRDVQGGLEKLLKRSEVMTKAGLAGADEPAR
jgi:transaldolase/glucose-6-phosphate isomerase